MRVAGLASRRWFRVAILGLLAAGLGALVVILALDDRTWAAVATLAAGIPILWLAKSGVESQTTMTRMRRTASEQQAKARERTAALADVSRANARSLSALDQRVSADVGRLAEAIRRVEVIEGDRIRIALDLEKSQNLLQAATVEIDTLRRGLADLADQTASHDSRIARLEPSRRKGTLPTGSRPELNMTWAMGSVTASDQVDESNDPGSGGSSDSNA